MNSKSVSEINLFDVKTQQCPYEAYKTLRNEAPVYQCPATGMYVITRFEDSLSPPAAMIAPLDLFAFRPATRGEQPRS